MDTYQYVLWRSHESKTIQGIHTTIPSSSRKKRAKERKSSPSRGKTSLQVLCKTWKKLYSSIMRYGCADISLYQTTGNKVRLKMDEANRNHKYGNSKWSEKPNFRDSRECPTQNNGCLSTY